MSEDVQNSIREWLKKNGYEEGQYCICAHTCGLPQVQAVWVKPDWSPLDGDHTLLVTADAVLQVVCWQPYNYRDWVIHTSHPYSNTDELKEILDKLVKQPVGCWAEKEMKE